MRYEFTYQIFPPHIFGIEDPDYTLVPALEGSPIDSPTVDSRTGKIVGRGTQTRARLPGERIQEQLAFRDFQCDLNDDFLTISINAADDAGAEQIASQKASDFCMVLAHVTNAPCRFEFVQALDDHGRPVAVHRQRSLMRAHVYNLDSIRQRLRNSHATFSVLHCHRLKIALIYYQKGLFLRDLFGDPRIERYPVSLRASTLGQEAFLNFWKSVAVILGEKKDGKRFQTFYTRLGYTKKDFEDKICRLYGFRDNYNIAHSSLDPSEELIDKNHVAECLNVAKDVIDRYISFLGKSSMATDRATGDC